MFGCDAEYIKCRFGLVNVDVVQVVVLGGCGGDFISLHVQLTLARESGSKCHLSRNDGDADESVEERGDGCCCGGGWRQYRAIPLLSSFLKV